MEVLDKVELGIIYNLYKSWYDTNSYAIKYYCPKCKHVFAVDWRPPTMSSHDGNALYCPSCREPYNMQINTKAVQVQAEGVPLTASLALKKFKNSIKLEIFYQVIRFEDLKIRQTTVKESFTFSKKDVTFEADGEVLQLGDPFDLFVFTKSLLPYISARSSISAEKRSQLKSLLKKTREAIVKNLGLKYKMSSMYISPGSESGYLLLPLFNMSFRTVFPDAPNLQKQYRTKLGRDRVFKKIYNRQGAGKFEHLRGKENFVDALLKARKIPITKTNRKIIANDFMEIDKLSLAHRLSKDLNVAQRIFNELVKKESIQKFPFLKFIGKKYGEVKIAEFLEKNGSLLEDCDRLYRNLNKANKMLLKTEKIRLRDLHDWMAEKHRFQEHENKKFEIPEHIMRRLEMQKDRLKFFLPKETLELYRAGKALHNCVASYSDRMARNDLQIVLIADDKGNLVACLEVRGNTLIQAKINQNKSVWGDKKLNAEILEWASGAGIRINTPDVKETVAV